MYMHILEQNVKGYDNMKRDKHFEVESASKVDRNFIKFWAIFTIFVAKFRDLLCQNTLSETPHKNGNGQPNITFMARDKNFPTFVE